MSLRHGIGSISVRFDDRGFTIIESVVALVIIFGLMLTLLRTFDVSVGVITQSNRRGNANVLASELIERSRSLEWEHMGLTSAANGAACPSEVGCTSHPTSITGQVTVNANGNYAFDGEEIVFANGATFDPFLSFVESVSRDDVDFERFLFVASVRDDPLDPATERMRRITAVVRWIALNGFAEEIRLVTFVAEFTEPSQPFIMGEISFDGGFVSVRGSDNRCGSDPECGAFVQGTSDFGGGPARENLEADLHLADMAMIATTDYVAGASYHGSSSAADLRWAGPDGLVTTADDSFTQFLQVGSEKFVDDDASSLPDLNEPRTVPIALIPELDLSAGSPFDLVIADLLQTGDLDTSTTPGLDNASVDGEAWTQHDTDPGIPVTDGLLYAAAELDSAETTRIGFREYVDAGVRTFYELWLGSSLAASEYEFVLGRSGDSTPGEALSYAGVVDRYDDISSNRQVHNDVTWSGETLYIAADEVYPNEPGSNDFEGWVRITLPRIDTGTPIKAGESAPYPPGITITNDLEVEFWDAATKKSCRCSVASVRWSVRRHRRQ